MSGKIAAELLQLPDQAVVIFLQHLDLRKDCFIQHIAVDIGAAAPLPFAPFFHFAHIGVCHFSFRCFAFRKLRIHPFSAAAKQQPCQQRLVASGLPVSLGFVSVQRCLNLNPLLGRYDTGMLSDCDDPLGHGQQNGGSSLFLVGSVVGHDACAAQTGDFLLAMEKI